jgi:hypothetical protein
MEALISVGMNPGPKRQFAAAEMITNDNIEKIFEREEMLKNVETANFPPARARQARDGRSTMISTGPDWRNRPCVAR